MPQNETSLEKVGAELSSQVTEWIMGDIKKSKITPIPGYDMGNEIITAMMVISQTVDRNKQPALSVCSKASIMQALRDMAIQGLSMGRGQCYAIVYGNQLQIQRSYFGTMAVLERFFPDYLVCANVLFMDDGYEYKTDPIQGFNYITNVQSSLENRDKPIIAAYCNIVNRKDRELIYGDVMTMAEIKRSWSKAKTSNVQNEFPQEMAKRTIINRTCKKFVKSSPSCQANPEIVQAFNRTTANEYEPNDYEVTYRNATPEEQNVRKAIKGKSKGIEGLNELLASGTPIEASPRSTDNASRNDSDAKVDKNPTQGKENAPEPEFSNPKPSDANGDFFGNVEAGQEMEEIPF